jgi:hypothetical protein
MLQLDYNCQQPVFYLGSSLVYLSATTVYLAKLHRDGKITMMNLLLLLVINALIIYVISRLINWLCVHRHNEAAWLVALLPIFGVLVTSVN